jgi:hypothetical protein
VLDEDDRHRLARLELRSELPHRRGAIAAQRALGRMAALALVEAEVEELRDEPAGAAAAHVDGVQLAGLGVAADEERLDDAQCTPALGPLERADQLPLVLRCRGESVEQQLRGRGSRHRGHAMLAGHGGGCLIRMG